MKDLLHQAYGFIFEKDLLDEIANNSTLYKFKADDYIIEIGEYIKSMPLLVHGAIKIMREAIKMKIPK